MEKIAIVTDTHFDIRPNDRLFDLYQKKIWREFWSILECQGINRVYHLGDVFHNRKELEIRAAMRAHQHFFNEAVARDIEVVCIVGNHDTYYKTTSKPNSLQLTVDEQRHTVLTFPEFHYVNSTKFLLVPWINQSNRKEIMEVMLAAQSACPVAMGHFEFAGFELHKGYLSSGLNRFDPQFAGFNQIYSGHFHERMQIGNIQYIGAMSQYDWSDFNRERGFNIYDGTTMKFVPNRHVLFGVIDLQSNEIPDLDVFHNQHIKLLVNDKTKQSLIDRVMEKLSKQNCQCRVMEEKTFVSFQSADLNSVPGVDHIIENYIESVELDGVSKQAVIHQLLKLHKEAVAKSC